MMGWKCYSLSLWWCTKSFFSEKRRRSTLYWSGYKELLELDDFSALLVGNTLPYWLMVAGDREGKKGWFFSPRVVKLSKDPNSQGDDSISVDVMSWLPWVTYHGANSAQLFPPKHDAFFSTPNTHKSQWRTLLTTVLFFPISSSFQ